MLSSELTIVIVASAINLFLGIFTLLKNYKSVTNRLFFLFATSLSVYNFFNYVSQHQNNDQSTLLWIRLVMFIALTINLLFFLLVANFPHVASQLHPRKFKLALIATLILLPTTLTPLIFSSVRPGTNRHPHR